MRDVVETLVIAILLVILVVYLFLQRLAGHLDPYAGCPCFARRHVCAVSALFGFFQSTHCQCWAWSWQSAGGRRPRLWLCEGVQRHIEEGLAPKDAALKAMKELSGPVVGIALVLASVLRPYGVHSGHHRETFINNSP